MKEEHYLIQFFKYDHLPKNLKEISRQFHMMAHFIDCRLEESPEKTTALRKLLEAKDCAVRGEIFE